MSLNLIACNNGEHISPSKYLTHNEEKKLWKPTHSARSVKLFYWYLFFTAFLIVCRFISWQGLYFIIHSTFLWFLLHWLFALYPWNFIVIQLADHYSHTFAIKKFSTQQNCCAKFEFKKCMHDPTHFNCVDEANTTPLGNVAKKIIATPRYLNGWKEWKIRALITVSLLFLCFRFFFAWQEKFPAWVR